MKTPLLMGAATALVLSSFSAAAESSSALSSVTVTTTRSEIALEDALPSVTLISREDIERLQPNDIADLLRFIPGVDVARSGGAGQQVSAFIRGGNSDHTLYLIDGVRFTTETFLNALMHRGELVLGVSCAPCWNGGEGELAWAVKGQGAWLDGERITVSQVDQLPQATLSLGNLARLAQSPGWAVLGSIIPQLHRIRGYADFLHYHLLASGRIDAVVETNVNILDIAALSVIVKEAGGRFTELDGGDVGLDTTTVLATNGRLHPRFASISDGLRSA